MDESLRVLESPDDLEKSRLNFTDPRTKEAMKSLGLEKADLTLKPKIEFIQSKDDPEDIVTLRYKNH